jgi:undecaprenyl-diphosphatase
MQIYEAVALGVIQGVSEFLPISTSAHVMLAHAVFGIENTNLVAFSAVLHLGSVIALIAFFSADLWIIAQALLRKLGRLPVNERDLGLGVAVTVAALPPLIAGILINIFFPTVIQSVEIMAGLTFISAIFYMFVEWRYLGQGEHEEQVSVSKGASIGFFSLLSLLPGFSRTGSAIGGGMYLGLSRLEAVRFSFLVSIPVLLGYSAHEFLLVLKAGEVIEWKMVLTSGVVAFVCSLFSIKFFLSHMARRTLWPFIWYTVIFAALAGYVGMIT